jgi:adhesin transport system outer membrane protein
MSLQNIFVQEPKVSADAASAGRRCRPARRLKATLLSSAVFLAMALPAQATGLKEAVELSLATNPDLGIVAANREAVNEELRQARGLYLPQVDLAAGIGRERTEDRAVRADPNNGEGLTLTRQELSLSLQQRIFDGFESDSTVAREKARLRSASMRVAENAEFLALDVIGVYLNVIRQRELVRLAETNLAVHMEILDNLRERQRGGAGSRADVVQTEARSARARATLTQTLEDLRVAETDYTRVVGQVPDDLTPPAFPVDVLPLSLDEAVAQTQTNNPTTKIFEADVRAADAEVSLSESPFYPAVTLEAISEYNDNRDGIESYEWNNQIMLRLRWNLYRGGIDRAARQESLARLMESKNRRLQSQLNAEQEMRQSWYALEANQQRVDDLADSVRFNTETRDAYREQFNVAQRTLLDVLDAENELFVSSGQLVTAQTNELLASYRILAVSGALLNTLGVPAPEQAGYEETTWFQGVGFD